MRIDGKNFRVKLRMPNGKIWSIAVYSVSRNGAKKRAYKRLAKTNPMTWDDFISRVVELKMIDGEKKPNPVKVEVDAPRDYTVTCTFDVDCNCIQCGGV